MQTRYSKPMGRVTCRKEGNWYRPHTGRRGSITWGELKGTPNRHKIRGLRGSIIQRRGKNCSSRDEVKRVEFGDEVKI